MRLAGKVWARVPADTGAALRRRTRLPLAPRRAHSSPGSRGRSDLQGPSRWEGAAPGWDPIHGLHAYPRDSLGSRLRGPGFPPGDCPAVPRPPTGRLFGSCDHLHIEAPSPNIQARGVTSPLRPPGDPVPTLLPVCHVLWGRLRGESPVLATLCVCRRFCTCCAQAGNTARLWGTLQPLPGGLLTAKMQNRQNGVFWGGAVVPLSSGSLPMDSAARSQRQSETSKWKILETAIPKFQMTSDTACRRHRSVLFVAVSR